MMGQREEKQLVSSVVSDRLWPQVSSLGLVLQWGGWSGGEGEPRFSENSSCLKGFVIIRDAEVVFFSRRQVPGFPHPPPTPAAQLESPFEATRHYLVGALCPNWDAVPKSPSDSGREWWAGSLTA